MPLGSGRDHPRDVRLSLSAATRHARQTGHSGEGRVLWTAGNLLRLVAVVVVLGSIVVGLLYGGWTVGRDEAASQEAVLDHFDAIVRGDEVAAVVAGCDESAPLDGWVEPGVAEALSAASRERSEVRIAVGRDVLGERRHAFEVPGELRGTVAVQPTGHGDQWRVCGFLPGLDVAVPD